MTRQVSTALVRVPDAAPFIVVKLPKGTVHTHLGSEHIINALRKRLPPEQLILEIVVMDGEPSEQPKLFATSHDIEMLVQSILPKLFTQKWKLAKLDG